MRGDLIPGTAVEVLVGQHEEMAARGYERHLIAILANSAMQPDATC